MVEVEEIIARIKSMQEARDKKEHPLPTIEEGIQLNKIKQSLGRGIRSKEGLMPCDLDPTFDYYCDINLVLQDAVEEILIPIKINNTEVAFDEAMKVVEKK